MPEPGDIIADKYRVLEQLGAGAMGVVFAAVHVETEKQVALKWLHPASSRVPGSAERFKLEAKATGRIHHPNVVAIHDFGEHAGQLYLVMERLVGRTLRACMQAAPNGCLSVAAALELLFPVMRGVAAAHAAGVLHRDIKPENVLLAESPDGLPPVPKVLDFGLAKLRRDASPKLSLPGSLLGTYQYMAPEQLRKIAEPDVRMDVYALGAMLYEMLTGRPPYSADNPVDLALQVLDAEPPRLELHEPELSGELADVVARALAREPDERFASVDELAAALERFSAEQRFRGVAAAPAQPSASGAPHGLTRSREPGTPRAGIDVMSPAVAQIAAREPARHFELGFVAHLIQAHDAVLAGKTQLRAAGLRVGFGLVLLGLQPGPSETYAEPVPVAQVAVNPPVQLEAAAATRPARVEPAAAHAPARTLTASATAAATPPGQAAAPATRLATPAADDHGRELAAPAAIPARAAPAAAGDDGWELAAPAAIPARAAPAAPERVAEPQPSAAAARARLARAPERKPTPRKAQARAGDAMKASDF